MTALDGVVEYAAAQLSDRERDVLYGRGVSDEQIEQFRLGYLNNFLPEGAPEEFIGWARGKMNDVFVFPLTTTLGEVRGLQLRHVDRSVSGYMDYFLPRTEACLFGLAQAIESMWTTRSVFLVEGAFDLFPVQRAAPMTVATLTARTSSQMIRVLRRYVDHVWLGYDMDSTGRAGCEEFEKRHGKDFKVYVVSYPIVNGNKIKDPGDLWEAWGDAQLVPFIRSTMKTTSYARR